MPKDRPLVINKIAIVIVAIGIAFFIFFCIWTGNIDVIYPANNKETEVPIPKNIIHKALPIIEPIAKDPAKAIYTNPQGKRPFTIPKILCPYIELLCHKGFA